MLQLSMIQKIVIWFLPVLFAITVHEVAHGWVASKLGDQTAKMLGRLTLNPFKHIDLVGTILVPFLLLIFGGVIFGWAKPVPINSRNFQHLRRDLALVSLAGPISNLIMAIFWAVVMKGGLLLLQTKSTFGLPITLMGEAGIQINLILGVLNLIPIPPLDGGHFLANVIPPKWGYYFSRLEKYGLLIVLILVSTGMIRFLLLPPVVALHHLLTKIFGL
jgi:Zn-dependent protease